MMLLQSFFARIIKDFRQKELLPLKLIFFVQASTLYVLYPYLTIHMRELGINVEETAIMSAVTPIVAIVMPPLAGMVADRIGNFRVLLSLFSVLGGASALLLLLVPIGRVTVIFPDKVVMDLSCPSDAAGLLYTMSQKYPCDTKPTAEVEARIESCGYACHVDDPNVKDVENLMTSRHYGVTIFDTETGQNSSFTFDVPKSHISPVVDEKERMKEHRKLSNNNFFNTTIRQVSRNIFFFPTPGFHRFSCAESAIVDVNETTVNGLTSRIFENRTLCRFADLLSGDAKAATAFKSFKTQLKSLTVTGNDVSEERKRFLAERVSRTGNDFQAVKCADPSLGSEKVVMTVPLVNYTVGPDAYKTLRMERCSKKCIATAPRKQVCSNKDMEVEFNIAMTFWLYLVIRVFIGIIGGTTFAMFEGAVIAILREQKADYGLQRIYGSIGSMISSPLSGFLIDYASSDKGYTDFRPAFYLYAALKGVSGILMLAINLEFKSPATNVVRDVLTVFRNVEMAALFIACFILGTAWGYIESFLFWLIQDLGGSRSLMGITITVSGIAGIPLLVLSGPIISRIGHANVLFIGFIFYAVRLFGYSVIYNPWLTLIFEALESVTSSLSFTAAVTYAAKLSTTTTDSSVQGLLGGVYYGVGKGSGSLIGGYLMKFVGTRPTYQIFGVMSLITGFLYFFFNVAYLKKRPQVEGNDIVKKKPKKTENQNGLESGINLKLDEKKQKPTSIENIDSKEEKPINGVVNDSFSKSDENEPENRKKNLEEVNNAKNSDDIKKVSEKSGTKLEVKSEKESGGQKQNLSNGVTNAAFINETEDSLPKCNVTIERQPGSDKK